MSGWTKLFLLFKSCDEIPCTEVTPKRCVYMGLLTVNLSIRFIYHASGDDCVVLIIVDVIVRSIQWCRIHYRVRQSQQYKYLEYLTIEVYLKIDLLYYLTRQHSSRMRIWGEGKRVGTMSCIHRREGLPISQCIVSNGQWSYGTPQPPWLVKTLPSSNFVCGR